MIRIIWDLMADWKNLDERIERVTDEIEALARRNASGSYRGSIQEPYRSSVKVVAGVGFESTTFRVMSLTSKSATYVQPAIDCLG